MAYCNHINIKDENGQVYCRRLDSVVTLNGAHQASWCVSCPMLAGSAQGDGIECYWNDSRPEAKDGGSIMIWNPLIEMEYLNSHEAANPQKKTKLYVKGN